MTNQITGVSIGNVANQSRINNQKDSDNSVRKAVNVIKNNLNAANKNMLYAGNLTLGDNAIEKRRKEAQKNAMKVISEAFSKEKELDQTVSDNQKRIADLNKENSEYMGQLDKLKEDKENLMETYGVTEDSNEDKDLKLLQKEEESKTDPKVKLTKEEKQHLDEIQKNGLSEYQQAGLDNYKISKTIQGRIDENNKQIVAANEQNKAIRLGRLKSHPMVDAKKEANEILDNANDQIKGMIVEEAKKNIDDQMDEKKEQALDEKEEKQQDEKLKAAREEKKKEQEILTDKTQQSAQIQQDNIENSDSSTAQTADLSDYMVEAQKQVDQMIEKMKLTEEDIKGIEVNSQV